MYVLGGVGDSGSLANTSYFAHLNTDGSLGTWQTTTNLPSQRYYPMAAALNGYIYVAGGADSSQSLDTTMYAAIGPNGKLGEWRRTRNLPSENFSGGAAVAGGNLYVVGGDATNALSSVNITTLQSIARIGHYSKLFNLRTDTTDLLSIEYTGDLWGGQKAITYQVAGNDAIFGSTASSSTLPNTPIDSSSIVCQATLPSVNQYVWVDVELDDSQRAAFPDAPISTISSLTVNYNVVRKHPGPDVRLRGGQYFYVQNLQPLDTCPN